jgi:hypothetical protein
VVINNANTIYCGFKGCKVSLQTRAEMPGYLKYGKRNKKRKHSDITVYNANNTIKTIITIKTCHRKTRPKKYQSDRQTERYEEWRSTILKRDNNQCVICKSTYRPQVHHIIRWVDSESLRYDLKNGVVICLSCHNAYHGPHKTPFPCRITQILIKYIGRLYG